MLRFEVSVQVQTTLQILRYAQNDKAPLLICFSTLRLPSPTLLRPSTLS